MNMNMEWMRSAMTVIAFATFIGIVLWAWSSRKRGDFDAAARSVLLEDEAAQGKGINENKRQRQ
jgi:cytochrome c oxidase cbb3-type subunit IV